MPEVKSPTSSSSSATPQHAARGEEVSVYNDDKFSDSGFVGYVTPMCNDQWGQTEKILL